jgi:hypothetical protein
MLRTNVRKRSKKSGVSCRAGGLSAGQGQDGTGKKTIFSGPFLYLKPNNAFAKTGSGQTHIGKITPKPAAPFFLVDHRRPSGDPSNRPQRSAQILAGDSGAGNASSFFGAVFKYSNRCFLSRQARDEHGETLREM